MNGINHALGLTSLGLSALNPLRRASNSASGSQSAPTKQSKRFANGDEYVGGWLNGLPEGDGRYKWADGSSYEGVWKDGQKHGLGTYTWPSGAVYTGEWRQGCMHGQGRLTGTDDSNYQGGWAKDLKHGLGRKVYANGDTFEGLWKEGKPDGPGRYRWKNRNEYDGEWKAGKMHGQGTLIWATGERYDGEWRDGEEDGLGVFTWADGSTYDGFWACGRKHGLGVFRPAPLDGSSTARKPVGGGSFGSQRHLSSSNHGPSDIQATTPAAVRESLETSAAAATEASPRTSPRRAVEAGGQLAPEHSANSKVPPVSTSPVELPVTSSSAPDEPKPSTSGRGPDTVYVRDYDRGRLLREEAFSAEQVEVVLGPLTWQRTRRRLKRNEKRELTRAGEKIYKGHRSYDLMLNLQLGIRCAVGKISAEVAPDCVQPDHFKVKLKQYFPREGSPVTPPHPSYNFKWKEYCPVPFRRLRELFKLDAAEYMLSICGDQALRELPSPGKSGSVFFISHDERFFIKTMRKEEVKLLMELLPRYYAHVEKYPQTLLIKFYGLHRVKPIAGQKVRFVVMNNLFRTERAIHRKYDLKGSTLGRYSGKAPGPNTILKDLDLDIKLKLDPAWHDRLMAQLAADCELLEELRVMDYSLLLGLHYRSVGDSTTPLATTDKEDEGEDETPSPSGTARRSPFATPLPISATNGNANGGGGAFSPAAALSPAATMAGEFPREPLSFRWGSGLRQSLRRGASTELPASPSGREMGTQTLPNGLSSAGSGREGGGGTDGAGASSDDERVRRSVAALRSRLSSKFGDQLGDRRLEDLLKLARYRMVGRGPNTWRGPTAVLSTRPLRSDTLSRALVEAPEQEAADAHAARLGSNMPATCLPNEALLGPEDVVLYFGIIDILQAYNARKRLEHNLKAALRDGNSISSVNPAHYSRRFQKFLRNVFVT